MSPIRPKPMRFSGGVDTGEGGARQSAALLFAGEFIEGIDLLDVGCWTGAFPASAARSARSVVAVDIEGDALEVARQAHSSVSFVEGSVLDLPFEDGAFDVVTFFAVLEHLPLGSESRALAEVARVLRPGGYVVMNTPFDNPFAKALDPIFLLKGHRHYSRERIGSLLEEAGFLVERMEVKGRLLTALDFLLFSAWKYLLRRRGPNFEWYRRACERDASRKGYMELYAAGSLAVVESGHGPGR